MQYFISFLEGIITFISPCLLPMLPIYISYFANGQENKKRTIQNASAFVLGFTVVFVSMGAFAGGIGNLLTQYSKILNIVTGCIVVLLGLNFTGLIQIGFINQTKKLNQSVKQGSIFTTFLFGIIFAIGWTPCVGAFLGSALMMASQRGSMLQGVLMLIVYSMGLGIPFILSAVLIDKLKGTFEMIKKHYRIVNIVSGGFLIIVGIMMMTGTFGLLLNMFNI